MMKNLGAQGKKKSQNCHCRERLAELREAIMRAAEEADQKAQAAKGQFASNKEDFAQQHHGPEVREPEDQDADTVHVRYQQDFTPTPGQQQDAQSDTNTELVAHAPGVTRQATSGASDSRSVLGESGLLEDKAFMEATLHDFQPPGFGDKSRSKKKAPAKMPPKSWHAFAKDKDFKSDGETRLWKAMWTDITRNGHKERHAKFM